MSNVIDGRPAEYRWRPLFNAAKFGWHPLLECRAVMLPRRKTRWNLQGCPKLANGSQLLVGRSSPYCGDVCRRYCCLTFSCWLTLIVRVVIVVNFLRNSVLWTWGNIVLLTVLLSLGTIYPTILSGLVVLVCFVNLSILLIFQGITDISVW